MKKNMLMVCLATFISLTALAQNTVHKIVIQLNSSDTLVWQSTLRNISNIQAALGSNTQIELVAHGSGLGLLIDSKTNQKTKIIELVASGVLFKACENTIRERKIDKSTIIPQSGFVASGVTEVILKQEAGWSYLKAGF